jgi:hypothetical protein
MIWLWGCDDTPVIQADTPVIQADTPVIHDTPVDVSVIQGDTSINVSKAPTRKREGLTLGESGHPEVVAWLNNRSCTQFPAPTRASFQYRCEGSPEILIVRAENAPIHFFSTTDTVEVTTEAITLYHSRLDSLIALFGTPTKEKRVESLEQLKGERIRLARFQGLWEFQDLEVSVTLLKSRILTVQESWLVPGAEEKIQSHPRMGSLVTGQKPPGWNPHVDR